MQPRYRSSGDGFRLGSGYWNHSRGVSFGRGHPRRYPAPQPIGKADIFMQAGRLAADYLVSKGLLAPESLPVNVRNQEFTGPERELHFPDDRAPALAHPRINRRGERRRYDPYGGGHGFEWGSREDGRRGPWMDRSGGRRYHDTIEDGDDDFARSYARVRRGRYDTRFGSEEQHSKSEVTGESGTELDAPEMADDTGSRASSSSSRRDSSAAEDEVDESKATDDAKILNTGDEVKSEASGDSQKNPQVEDADMQPADEVEPANKHEDLLKLSGLARVPTKPCSPVSSQRSLEVDKLLDGEVNSKMEVAELGAFEVIEGGETIKGYHAHTNQPNNLKCQEADVSSTLQNQSMEELEEPKNQSRECPPGFGSSTTPLEVSNEGGFAQHIDKMEGIKTQIDISPHRLSQETEYCAHDFGKPSSPGTLKFSTYEKMVEGVDQEKRAGTNADFLPKVEPEFHVKLEEERDLLTTSFDLNLMGTPETTDIPHSPMLNHLQTCGSILENGKELPVDASLSIGNNTSGTGDYNGISVDGKVIPVINLEDVSTMEENTCDPSKLKNSTSCSSLDNFLNQTVHADLDGMQDGYSLAFPEFLGTDISGCSSVPRDLNNLQTDISLRDTQGVQGGDDSIYVSLEEIPIGLMGVWDQPPQDYGKFF